AGLFSTVDDVAAWVRFLAAADAPDSASRPAGPLATASRREVQQLHRHHPLAALPADPGAPSRTSPGFDRVRGYGLRLVVEHVPDLGDALPHPGGCPGYGSLITSHRGSGVGVVALANSTYAPVPPLSMKTLRLLQRELPDLLARRPLQAAARTLEAAEAALTWLREGD